MDDYTLKISFKNVTPVEDWLILHNKYFYVLPEHLLGDIAPEKMKDDEFWKAPIGSGPCTFISELSGSQLELGSFADYQLGAPAVWQTDSESDRFHEYDHIHCSRRDGWILSAAND